MYWCIIFQFTDHCFQSFLFTVAFAQVWIMFWLRCLYLFLCMIPPNWLLIDTRFVVRRQLGAFNIVLFLIPGRFFLFVLRFHLLRFTLPFWIHFVFCVTDFAWVVEGVELLVEFKFEFAQRFNFSIKWSYLLRQLLDNFRFSTNFFLFFVLLNIIWSLLQFLLHPTILVFGQSFRFTLDLLVLTFTHIAC